MEDADLHRKVLCMLRAQLGLQEILRKFSADLFLPLDAARQFRDHVDALLQTYQLCAAEADAKGVLLWNQPTKWHWLWHLSRHAHFQNPRRNNTMLDEDFVGRIKDLAAACATGTELHEMPRKTLEKYRWAFHFLARGS